MDSSANAQPGRLRFGVHAGASDNPYLERRDYWREADNLGYAWASVSDHFVTNPIFGARDTDPWNEAWTSLAALAEATSRIHVGVLVSSVGYRNPAILAKMAATVDVISRGRLEFGIGAGYLESEYRMYGIPFPNDAVRLAQLNEALHICKLLWTCERSDFAGQHFTLHQAVCEPKPIRQPHPPIWIGGMGEQKTLRMVAEHADGWNAFPIPPAQMQHKLEVLRRHCADVGRDYHTISKQLTVRVVLRQDPRDAETEIARFAESSHVPLERARQMMIGGTPETVQAYLEPYVQLGFEMFLLMETTPLDYTTLQIFMADVAPHLSRDP